MAGEFLSDIQGIRSRARQHIERGAVTEGYQGDLVTIIRLLNDVLATEIVCVLRYKRHFYMASGINAQSVAQEFLQHANEEQLHADQVAARIVQLGGAPNFSPEGLATRSHSEYVEGETLIDMIREDLVAEVLWVDRFGNCQLNVDPVEADEMAATGALLQVTVGEDLRTAGRARAYADVPPGRVGLVTDSSGLVSLALPQRSAADELGLREGSEVRLAAAAAGDRRTGGPTAVTPVGLSPRPTGPQDLKGGRP